MATVATAHALKLPARKAGGAGQPQAGETILTAEAKPGDVSNRMDPGGMLDATVRDRESYVYVAQRVRKVTLEGHDLEIRGVASAPAAFTYQDTFPPRVPTGLISVPTSGFAGPPSIDLSWVPNSERDLLGYNVYRRTDSGIFTKLNPEPVASSSFRDIQVTPDLAYSYRVTAIGRGGSESPPSSEIHESLRQ